MHLIGRKIDNSAPSNSFRKASAAVAPISPSSMFASLTRSSGSTNARAIASSTSPSRKPMRKSPVRILTTYWPSRAESLARHDCNNSVFAIGPRIRCRVSKKSCDCARLNGSDFVRSSSASNVVFPASLWLCEILRNSGSLSFTAPIIAR